MVRVNPQLLKVWIVSIGSTGSALESLSMWIVSTGTSFPGGASRPFFTGGASRPPLSYLRRMEQPFLPLIFKNRHFLKFFLLDFAFENQGGVAGSRRLRRQRRCTGYQEENRQAGLLAEEGRPEGRCLRVVLCSGWAGVIACYGRVERIEPR